MISRKLSNNNNSSDTSSEAAIQTTMNYIREFCEQAHKYRQCKTEAAIILLHRSISLLSTTQPQNFFNPANIEISKFFIELHAVMSDFPSDSDALWACVSVLQHCCRNLEVRRAIVDDYRFVPLLTFVLKRTQAQDKLHRLLILLQELTYGIRISWEEPYVIVLIEKLVEIIYNVAEDNEDTQAQLALSILINLCYKNFVVLFVFLRTVNISTFSFSIQNYGMLANKMLMILSQDIHSPDTKEMHLFLRSTFASIDDCLKQWNVPHLRHIYDFLLDSKEHIGLHMAMLSYSHYCEDVERLLDIIEIQTHADDSNDETRKPLCMALLFKLIRYIVELSAMPELDGSENPISLDSNIPRIFELLCNWLESDVCGTDAVNLLEAIIRLVKKEAITSRIARDPSIVHQLIVITEKPETSSQHTTAILRLLLTLLNQQKTEKLILSKITESYFDKILAPLLSSKMEVPINAISTREIEKSIFCLLLLINFAGIAKKAYFEKCCMLLNLQQVQQALARSILSDNEMVCSAVFQISQFEHFPQEQVAKFISELNMQSKSVTHVPPKEQWYNLNAIFKSHKFFVSKEIDERLHALTEIISNAHRNNQINNLATSQVIELFNYKIEKLTSAESSLLKRLEDASNEISNLTQRVNLQNAELQKYHTMFFELHINQESLQTECKDLKQQRDNLKRNLKDLMKKMSELSESLQINEKRLSIKVSEVIAIQRECNEVKTELATTKVDLEKMEVTSRENAVRIEKLKKTIGAFEVDVKEKMRTIEERERELQRTQKVLDEQKDAKKKADDVIAVLEQQLQEKSEQIRSYENELSETEELRKAVMSLMESKKPKRKI